MFRRRRFSRSRRPAMQWVASPATYGTVTTLLPGNAATPLELAGGTGTATEFDPPTIQRFTVVSVRGNLQFFQAVAGTAANRAAVLGLGLAVVSVDPVTLIVPNWDPTLQTSAGVSWMWLRHWCFPESDSAALNFNITFEQKLPTGSDVSSRTKRVIRQNQILVLYAKVRTVLGSADGGYRLIPYLRTLISKVA